MHFYHVSRRLLVIGLPLLCISANTTTTVAVVTVGDNYIEAGATLSNGKPKLRAPVTVTVTEDGQPRAGISVTPSSTRGGVDQFDAASGNTDAAGVFVSTLKTLEKTPDLKVSALGAQSANHTMLPAVYRSQFAITGYFTPQEPAGGTQVSTTEITTRNPAKRYIITSNHTGSADFLQKVAIEGEGYFADGTHAVVTNQTRPGTSAPIIIDSTITTDTAVPTGTRNRPLVANSSCAVVNTVVPDGAGLTVGTYGARTAIDSVSATQVGGAYHIDLYTGFNETAASAISTTATVTLNSY